MLTNKLHPFNFIILPFIGLITTFLCYSWQSYLLILFIMFIDLMILVNYHLNYKNLMWFSLAIIPALAAMFISSYFFAKHSDLNNLIGNNNHHLLQTITLTVRLYTLAIISFGFMYHMPKEIVLTNLMQHKFISVKIGFSLLAVFNAAHYLKAEFNRIQIAYQMRYQQKYLSPKIILPLLIAAARYAHTLSISLYSRGLNQRRSYIAAPYKWGTFDWLICSLNCLVLFLILYCPYLIMK